MELSEMDNRCEKDVEIQTSAANEKENPVKDLERKTAAPDVADDMQNPAANDKENPVECLEGKTTAPDVVDDMQTPTANENENPVECLEGKTAASDVIDDMQTPATHEMENPVEGLEGKTPAPNVADDVQTLVAHETESADIKIGMEFETEQQAYDFYDQYAQKLGFKIRKSWFHKNKRRVVNRRRLCCSREGHKWNDKRVKNVKNQRESTRTGCLAHIVIALQPNGSYAIIELEAAHNHRLAPNNAHMFGSQKHITVAQAIQADIANNVVIRPKETFDFMSVKTGGAENVRFVQVDCSNFLLSKRMRSMEKEDTGYVLQYLQKMLANDPGSFYAIQLDEDGKISNIFWADSNMVNDYHAFGDVVCFDTTYRINNYDRPFAPFVGVNHHKQIVVFGAALMYDETSDSFKWVFKAFLQAMSEKEPKTILTDRDKAMEDAISIAFPNACHRICLWHMYQNAMKHLNSIFTSFKSFNADFEKCIHDYEEEVEFLEAWEMILEKYDLRENLWLQQLFNEREKWALVYGRNTFCADMKGTLCREGMNIVLQQYLDHSHSLQQFFQQFERLVFDKRMAEAEADFKMTQSTPMLVCKVPILFGARDMYTPEIFKLFQEEWVDGMNCIVTVHCTIGTIITYHVHSMIKNHDYVVTFDSLQTMVECTCKKFEFNGILCGHALRVFDHAGVVTVPDKYILKRWRKDAKVSVANISSLAFEGEGATSTRYKELRRNSMKLCSKAVGTQEGFFLIMKVINDAMDKLDYLDIHPTSNSASQCIPPQDMSAEANKIKGVKRTKKGLKGRPHKKSGLEVSTNRSSLDAQPPTSSVNRIYQVNPCMNQQDDEHYLISSQTSQASSVFGTRSLMTENEEGAQLTCSNIRMERLWTTGSSPSDIRMERPLWRP